MTVFKTASRIIITCNKRLSPFLEQEVVKLGFNPLRTFATGVELQGTVTDCIKLNLNLRCASQILYSVKEFTAKKPDDIYKTVTSLPWENLISANGYFSVTSNVDHITVNNNLFINVKVKDAIVDRIRNKMGSRPNSGSELDQTVVHCFWRNDVAEIFLDTSGETLAKHGYRKIPGKAPMLEALAASTLLASKWDRKSPFVNPMCGSSTIAIEAALLATNRAPGLYRQNYAFMHIKGYEESDYRKEMTIIKEQIVVVSGLEIIATDLSDDAIKISKVNANTAGVDKMISFEVCDFAKTHVPAGNGVVYFNPEYGERLGEVTALEETYSRIGDFMKNKCQGYVGYIFTGNLDLAKKIGLKASRRIEFYTAKIDGRLLEYELYAGTRRPKEELKPE
jgi:23S rRNA G2445 N2-methylase RlmL